MNNLNILKVGYLPWGYPSNWIKNFKQFFRNIKYAYQRVTRGYSDWDTWDLDTYYQQLFADSVRHFARNLHGAPYEFYDDNADNPIQKWEDYLNEMADHFDESLRDYFEEVDSTNIEEFNNFENYKMEEFYKGFDMMREVFFSLWD